MTNSIDQNTNASTITSLLQPTHTVLTVDLARCRNDENRDRWFPFTPEDLAYAQSVCAGCPLAKACLTAGQDNKELGVWGGRYLEKGVELPLPAERRRQRDQRVS